MKFKLYTDAVLARDIPEERLCRGDLVKLVDYHTTPKGEPGYSIEIFNALGETITVTSVRESEIEPLRADEVLSVRPLVSVA